MLAEIRAVFDGLDGDKDGLISIDKIDVAAVGFEVLEALTPFFEWIDGEDKESEAL